MTNIERALRQLVLRAGLSATVILLLAVGIGATSAMYSLIQQTILEPLPVSEPHELVSIKALGPKPGAARRPSRRWKRCGTSDRRASTARRVWPRAQAHSG